jgi:hypothetical protein
MAGVKVKNVSRDQAIPYLEKIGKEVNEWGQIVEVGSNELEWVNIRAPVEARDLMVFCQTIISWLPEGVWRIIYINNATVLNAAEELHLARILYGSKAEAGNKINPCLIIENDSGDVSAESDFFIVDIMYALLMFEGHAHIVSSGSSNHECLSIQDGFVYAYSSRDRVSSFEYVISNFSSNNKIPEWVQDFIGSQQL